MRDELFDRDFQHARSALNEGLDRGVLAIRTGLAGALDRLSDAIRPQARASIPKGC